jgi:hypothetical protein
VLDSPRLEAAKLAMCDGRCSRALTCLRLQAPCLVKALTPTASTTRVGLVGRPKRGTTDRTVVSTCAHRDSHMASNMHRPTTITPSHYSPLRTALSDVLRAAPTLFSREDPPVLINALIPASIRLFWKSTPKLSGNPGHSCTPLPIGGQDLAGKTGQLLGDLGGSPVVCSPNYDRQR